MLVHKRIRIFHRNVWSLILLYLRYARAFVSIPTSSMAPHWQTPHTYDLATTNLILFSKNVRKPRTTEDVSPTPTLTSTAPIGKKNNNPSSKASSSKQPQKSKIKNCLANEYAWAMSKDKDLPDFQDLYPVISHEQLLNFEREGHTVTRSLCTKEELADFGKIIRAAFEKEKLMAYRQKIRVLCGKEYYENCKTMEDCEDVLDEIDSEMIPFLQTFNSWKKYQDVRRLALAPRFAHIAAQLLGVPRVRLYQDSTFLKREGDGPTLWHSDLNMAPFNTNHFLTMWLPLTEIPPEEAGGTGLTFASASHRDFALNYWVDPHAGADLSNRYKVHSYGRLRLGDATWHHGWTLHSSAGNYSGKDRLAFTLCFVADGVPLLGKSAKHRPDDEDDLSYAEWLGDFRPGQPLTDHPLLPLVYDDDSSTVSASAEEKGKKHVDRG